MRNPAGASPVLPKKESPSGLVNGPFKDIQDGIPARGSTIVVHTRWVTHRGRKMLVTFAPGAVVGELALLDRGLRSATVTVDEDLTGFALSAADFDELCQ